MSSVAFTGRMCFKTWEELIVDTIRKLLRAFGFECSQMFPIRIANATVRFNARMFRFYLADVKVREGQGNSGIQSPWLRGSVAKKVITPNIFLAGNGEEVRLRQQDKKIIFIKNLYFITM